MIAANNQAITEAATTIYQISEDERIRQQCEAREDYLRRQRGIQRMMEELTKEKQELLNENERLKKRIRELESNIGENS